MKKADIIATIGLIVLLFGPLILLQLSKAEGVF